MLNVVVLLLMIGIATKLLLNWRHALERAAKGTRKKERAKSGNDENRE